MFGFKRSLVQVVILLVWCTQNCTFGYAALWYILTCITGSVILLAFSTYDHDYWLDKGVFSPPAWPLVGHIKTMVTMKEQGGICFQRIYDTYKDVRFLGKQVIG